MRIVLLQDEVYLPSLGGATKANRFLLEALSRSGHDCLALTRAFTRSPDGPQNQLQLMREMASRETPVRAAEPHVFSYAYQGVQIEAFHCPTVDQRREYLIRRTSEFKPDWVLVADDKRRFLLESAIHACPDRVILLLQTIMQLPFGPLAVHECPRNARWMSDARAIVVISNYLKEYVLKYGGLESHVLTLPFLGQGPFPQIAQFDAGFVTMINPCDLKGLSIFKALAREFARIEFAAVPTWGANDEVIRNLRELPNVRILEPADDIEEILSRTRVLLAPSLWPETFGYVVPEAMLRGIPVLASDIGGLPEAKLGVDYLLPVTPAVRQGNTYRCPPQETAPWSRALGELLSDSETYARCSDESRQAALKFVSRANRSSMERFLTELSRP